MARTCKSRSSGFRGHFIAAAVSCSSAGQERLLEQQADWDLISWCASRLCPSLVDTLKTSRVSEPTRGQNFEARAAVGGPLANRSTCFVLHALNLVCGLNL